MTHDTHLLAALIGSRICHDLISPVGAIQNGLELLAMDDRVSGPEMMLINESATNASARIRFLRVAFGLAGDGQTMGAGEITQILRDLETARRIQYDWQAVGDMPRSQVQEVFLACLCLESAMPRGGCITVSDAPQGGWAVSGPGEADRPTPRLWELLRTGTGTEGILPAHVQFVLLHGLVSGRAGQIATDMTGDGLTIRF